jgi:uncharacterized protein (TIGR03086 family)
MDVPGLYERAQDAFGRTVHGVAEGQWSAGTPCTDWDVRTLVNHVIGEIKWAVPLFAGRTIAEVGDQFDGDLLGARPVDAWDAAAPAAVQAVRETGAMDRTVHLSFGDFPGSEYAMQLIADLVVHGWDLATATGQDATIDAELVEVVGNWFSGVAAGYREAGAVAPAPAVSPDANAQTVLLAEFGRSVA